MKPQILSYADYKSLELKHPDLILHDQIDLAFDELFDIEFPSKKDSKTESEVNAYAGELCGGKPEEWGSWVYYPWSNYVVHFPPVEKLRALRTSRNRNLITADEQAQLYAASFLIIGMSVGSNVVEALVSQGIGSKLLLVDLDIIEPSNLNRIRSAYHQVGLHKVEAISHKVWEIDPYIEIVAYNDGLNEQNLGEIIAEHHPEIIVDEMDELRMKIKLREAAQAAATPVIMAADDGDNALIDIERYDLEPDLELFSGRIPAEILEKIKTQTIPRAELGMMIGKYFVGPENIPLRMYQSLGEVGKTLPSWPQLGGAAALSGITLAYVSKKIILGHKLKTGRVLVSLDEKLDLEHLEDDHNTELLGFQNMMGHVG
jgi:molybdopterin/thiamine biosynthesis adenylyltransferase